MKTSPSLLAAGRLRFSLIFLFLALELARASIQHADDDNLWLAYSGMPPSAEARAIEGDFQQRVSVTPGCSIAAFRLGLRDRYAGNYAGYLAINASLYRVWSAIDGPGLAAAWKALATTRLLICATALLLLIGAAARLPGNVSVAVAFALISLAAIDIFMHTGLVRSVWLPDATRPLRAAAGLGYSFIFAAEQHSLFGLTPRNAALALFATSMVLRWGGNTAAGALAVLGAGAMHQTYGGISLILFAVTTAISSPDRLKSLRVRILLTSAAIIVVMRESYFDVQLPVQIAAVAAVIVAAVLSFALVCSPIYGKVRSRLLGAWHDKEFLLDAAACIAICALVTCAALTAAPRSSPATAMYFWSDLTIRLWSFARFPVFMAVALWALEVLGRRNQLEGAGALAALLLTGAAAFQCDPTNLRSVPSMAAINAFDAAQAGIRMPREERAFYAHLALVSAGLEPASSFRRDLSSAPIVCTG